MGGRGAASGFVSSVPNADRATIADGKLMKYLLDPEKAHYPEFIAVGYSRDDPERLRQDLLAGLRKGPAKVYGTIGYGVVSFEVDTMLGVTREKRFRTVWRIDEGADYPRFVTAYRIGVNRK